MRNYDVVVLGTGASGLTAAMAAHDAGASVGLFEKSDRVGGTTAISGGMPWIPNNRFAAEAGIEDSREDALTYLKALSHGMIDEQMAEVLIDTGPELIAWLHEATPLRLRLVNGYPDYHPEHPGGKPKGGRSLEPELFAMTAIGEWADRLVEKTGPSEPHLMMADTPLGGAKGPIDWDVVAERRVDRRQGMGRGLVGSLLKGCLDRGIVPQTGMRAEELLMDGMRTTGVRFEGGEEVHASRGVIIATGGFEHDPALVRAFLRGPMTQSPGATSNTGDGLRMAMSAGAMLGTMREAWWVPIVRVPAFAHWPERSALILRERTLPGSIMVNKTGRRFANEATNYNALGAAFHMFDAGKFEYANQPAWLVFDQSYVDRYGYIDTLPGGTVPDYVTRADTIAGLAEAIGLPAEALATTIGRFNDHAARGEDPDFGRGESAYDGFNGDQSHYPGPMATLGPLQAAPFYAVPIIGSALGTKGGPQTDGDCCILQANGARFEGLYACGNAMAGATGMVYGGAGGTLGPAMVFGYRAGRHAGRHNAAA